MFGILRTILAIYVVLLHIFSIPTLGNYAVTFFFVLSGFLMTYIMQNTYNYNFNGVKLFWINRFLRLYPAYWIVLILSLVVICFVEPSILNRSMFFPSNAKEWFSNISMIYFDIVPHRIKPRVVPTSWALTNELIFYFLISIGISKTFPRTFIWLGLSITYYVATYFFYDIPTYRYSAIPASSLPFAIGAILYWINKKKSKIKVNFWEIIFVFTLFNINAVYLGSSKVELLSEISKYFNYILAAILVLLLFNFKTNKKITNTDKYIGYFSYPIYLSHYLVSAAYIYFFDLNNVVKFKISNNEIMLYFACLIVFCFAVVLVDIRIDQYKKRYFQLN